MLRLKPLRSIFLLFAVFGQNRYNWIFNSKWISIIFWNLKFFYLVFNLFSIFIVSLHFTSYNQSVVIVLLVFSNLIPNFIGIVEDWVHTNKVQLMFCEFNDLFRYLETSMCISVRITNFADSFKKKINLCFAILSIEFILKLLLPSERFFSCYTDIVAMFAFLYKSIAVFHVVLFIDLQRLVLTSLNEKLNPVSEENPKDCLIKPTRINEMLNSLPHIKAIYHKLWILSERINQRFGCFLLAAVLSIVTITIQSAMGIFIYLETSKKLLVLRK